MAENPTMAFLQQALSVSGANAPMEETALFNQFMQRLVTSGFTIDTGGNISAPFVITGVVNVSAATGTLAVAHGGTGAVTLTGLVVGNGTSAMTTVTAPSGTIVGTSDSQVLSNKTINGSGNTLTVRAANDITGVLPTANGGTGIAFFTAAGPSAARIYTFPDAATTVLTTNAAVTVPQGGTGLATLTANNVILGNGASTPAFVAPGTSGNLLTSNGTTWASTAPATPLMVLLKASSGTDTSAGATTVDSVATGVLTAKDRLRVFVTVEEATAQVARIDLYNVTDTTIVTRLTAGGTMGAGVTLCTDVVISQGQTAATKYVSMANGSTTGGASSEAANISMSTAWTTGFTLGLRHGGVTATGTFAYSWAVYVIRGQ